MSTQHFEYNGFPVSEGTVAAFPCGTVTAAPNRFARSRFGLAMAADIGRVGPWTGGMRMTGEGSAAVGAPDHRLARFTWNSDDLGQPFPHAAARPRFEGAFGPDFSLSVGFVGQPRTRWCARSSFEASGATSLGGGSVAGAGIGAVLADGLDCDPGFSSPGRERSARPLPRRRTAWRSGSSPPARSRRWRPSSRRRSTSR